MNLLSVSQVISLGNRLVIHHSIHCLDVDLQAMAGTSEDMDLMATSD